MSNLSSITLQQFNDYKTETIKTILLIIALFEEQTGMEVLDLAVDFKDDVIVSLSIGEPIKEDASEESLDS